MWTRRLARMVAVILGAAVPVIALADIAPAPPQGWVVFRTGSLGPNDLACARSASTAWEVSSNGDQLTIAVRRDAPRDSVQWTRFAGGRLVGENNGEFGGGIWWSDVRGWRGGKISSEN